jgi:hypothetical protein
MCTYPTGDFHIGAWKDGKPEGKGEKKWHDGREYKGIFYSGKPIGKGIKTKSDGTKIEGYWAGGKFFEGEPPEGVLE